MKSGYTPITRMQMYKGGPLRSTNMNQNGFYDIGLLRSLVESEDLDENDIRVSSIPIPRTTQEYRVVEAIARHPRITYGIVDKTKIMFLRIGNKTGWLSALNAHGFIVKGGAKTPKRAKQIHRPTLLNATFDNLNVQVVEPTHYTDYDFSQSSDEVEDWMKDPSVVERLLDGGFVISDRLINTAISNIPIYNPETSTDPMEYYHDGRVRDEMIRDLEKTRVYNVRIVGPMGIIKGNAFVASLPEGLDVITSRANIKNELSNEYKFYFIAEPQGPKTKVTTDIQTLINFPKLFRKSDLEYWLREEYKKMFRDVTNGVVLSNYKRVYQRLWREDEEEIDDEELYARLTYNGYRWVSMGLSVTNSPWLFQTLAISHAKPLQKRVPVPCAVYEQIIPESLAKMAGWEGTVERGTIRRSTHIGVHIINDLDWIESYESHGGNDADDFFKLFYRTIEGGPMDGEKVVIALRCPNGYGEYSIYRYVDGEQYPTWETFDGTVVSFPEVNGRNWPIRLSEAIRERIVQYSGLPSDYSTVKTQYSEYYTVDDFLNNVKNSMLSGNVGGYVNSVMLHSLTLHRHRPVQLCSLEAAIDGCTQTDDPQDRYAIDSEAETIVQEVIDSGKPIDEYYWKQRGFASRYKDAEVELYQGKVTQVAKLCKQFFNEYCEKVVAWGQENARPAPLVQSLGERMLLNAQADIRRFRLEIHDANSSPDNLQGVIHRSTWDVLYDRIVQHLESDVFENDTDKYDYVLALLHSSIKFPTSQGKITDQIVMNKQVYPYLERAFIHYGIGSLMNLHKANNGRLYVEDVRTDHWEFIDPDGNIHHFDDPLDYQRFHLQFSKLKRVAPPLNSVVSTVRPLNIKAAPQN